MSDLPPLLIEALNAIGPETEARMGNLISDFVAVPLSEEGPAVGARRRGRDHRDDALPATSADLYRRAALLGAGAIDCIVPGSPQIGLERRRGPVEEAQDELLTGLDAILRAMVDDGTAKHHRLVTELAVMAQLLGRYDAHSIHLVLTAASLACDDPRWRIGNVVPVLLSDGGRLLARDNSLETIAPRGTA